jgi:hypothetical protein
MTTVVGKRRDLGEGEYALEMGEYGKNSEGKWFCRPPVKGYGVGSLGKHTITEHDDGTITVSPSILFYNRDGSPGWHGYLERGVWREV